MATSAKRRPRTKKDPNAERETKEAKFSRLATARLNTAIKKISLIANLSGPGYSYSAEQVEKIAHALRDTVDETMGRFVKNKPGNQEPIKV